MDKSQPSDRPLPGSVRLARRAWTRRTGGNDPARTQQFRLAVDGIATRLEVTPNAVFLTAPEWGKSTHWMRERYYGRAAVALDDIEWAQAIAHGRPVTTDGSTNAQLVMLRSAVAAYCGTCANMNARHPSGKPYCFDGDCELRPASPLPLRNEL